MKRTRIKEMADYISKYDSVTVEQLAKHFNVSVYTVRRDINELAERKLIIKNYGGVSINYQGNALIEIKDRNTVNLSQKKHISKIAASLIRENDVVFIDGGTTTLYIPEYLEDINITVITNNVLILPKLIAKAKIKVIVIGGDFDRRTYSITGINAINFISNLNISKSFISCTGITKDFALTNFTAVDAELKKICIQNSNESYILADGSKFEESSLFSYASVSQLTGVITDKIPKENIIDYCTSHDVKLYYN
ncbi:MAG: DeoR/GlpR transcriptional regulator [Bacilli bacterium]|nr:DeoR/GlpR transcriptional regulator [Bacilli bacterium]